MDTMDLSLKNLLLNKFLFSNCPYLYKRLRVANPILIPSLWHRWQLNRNIFKCFCNKKERSRIKNENQAMEKERKQRGKTFESSFSFPEILKPQCYRQWLFKAPLCITLKIKIWAVAYFFNFFKLFQTFSKKYIKAIS